MPDYQMKYPNKKLEYEGIHFSFHNIHQSSQTVFSPKGKQYSVLHCLAMNTLCWQQKPISCIQNPHLMKLFPNYKDYVLTIYPSLDVLLIQIIYQKIQV